MSRKCSDACATLLWCAVPCRPCEKGQKETASFPVCYSAIEGIETDDVSELLLACLQAGTQHRRARKHGAGRMGGTWQAHDGLAVVEGGCRTAKLCHKAGSTLE